MTLDFNEISDHKKFEDLVVSYFEDLKNETGNNISDIRVKPSGVGTDGGRDILVIFKITDSIATFERRWVIQCKFHKSSISPKQIYDVNIPTLLASYKANGYLLVCREKATSKLTKLFEDLEKNVEDKHFTIWSGEQFKSQLLVREKILQQYFPRFYAYFLKDIKPLLR